MILIWLRIIPTNSYWRVKLWSWVIGLLALSAFLGSIVHGVQMDPYLNSLLWHPLNLCLGLVISLFVAGAFGDWYGRDSAIRIVPWCIGIGTVFFCLTIYMHNEFIIFVIYEAVGMLIALSIYTFIALTRPLKGAAIICIAIVLNIVAAAVQASDLSLFLLVPFDHNGLFHLLQMAAIAILALGLSLGMSHEEPKL